LIMEGAIKRDESSVNGGTEFWEESRISENRDSTGKGLTIRSGEIAIIGGISTIIRD
jgi:hypothetical protein